MARPQSVIYKISRRNLGAHKLRLVLTVLAVVLGTAFIAGSMMFTRSLSNAFDSAVSSQFQGVDAVVSSSVGVGPELRESIEHDPAVKAVDIEASTTVVLADENHNAIQTRGRTISVKPLHEGSASVGPDVTMKEGTSPQGLDQVAIDYSSAQKLGLKLGQRILVVDPQDRHEVTISGFSTSEAEEGGGTGSSTVWMNQDAYMERYTHDGRVPQLKVAAAEGTTDQQLVDTLKKEHPELKVELGEKLADNATGQLSQALKFVNYFLISFGLVALLVGTFLIANTFSMIVAQRTKEFALLRALGARKRQITRSVVWEAAIIGLIGSAIGILGGVGLVALIRAILGAMDMELPGTSLGISPMAIISPLLIGVVVTIISAWVPARKAGEVEPVEAMREAEQDSDSSLALRTIAGAILVIAGVISALIPQAMPDSETSVRAILVGVGAVAVIVGFFLASPALSIPIVPTIGKILGLPFGKVGQLSATNSRRHPRRTAATAFALTLGIALVTAIGAFGDTMKTAVSDMTESTISADYLLSGPSQGNFPVPAKAVDEVKNTEGVGEVTTVSVAPLSIDGIFSNPMGISYVIDGDPTHVFDLTKVAGDTDLNAHHGVLIDQGLAKKNNWKVGDEVDVELGGAPLTKAPISGIYENSKFINGPVISRALLNGVIDPGSMQIQTIGVRANGDISHADLRENLEKAVKDFIVVQVMDQKDMADQSAQIVDQMLNILYGLLALAVVIAILGIVNTLTLNVIERRREIGMLRAVGMHRKQVRRMITLEAVQIAIFGALAGIIIGAFLAWCFLKVLSGEGLETVSFPVLQIILMLIGSAIIGVVAAMWPARKAAKTPPLDAVAD